MMELVHRNSILELATHFVLKTFLFIPFAMCSNAVPSSSQRERTRQRGGMDFDSMAIFYLIPILEIVEKTPSRGLHPTTWLA